MNTPDTGAILNASYQLTSLMTVIFEHPDMISTGGDLFNLTGLAVDLSAKVEAMLCAVEAAEEAEEDTRNKLVAKDTSGLTDKQIKLIREYGGNV